jgi:hypothetical protein
MPPAAPPRPCIVSGHSSSAWPQFGAAAFRLNIRPLPPWRLIRRTRRAGLRHCRLACVSGVVACRAVGVILGAFPISLGCWVGLPSSPLAVAAALFLSLWSVVGWVPALPTSCWSPPGRPPTSPVPAVSPADPLAEPAPTLRIGDPPFYVLAAHARCQADADVGDSLAVMR